MSQLSPTSCCSAMMMPPMASSGAVTSIVAPIIASICTCCTSFVLRVMSEPGPNFETSRSEKPLTLRVDVAADVAAGRHRGARGEVGGDDRRRDLAERDRRA